MEKLWNMKVTIVPIVIGAFGTITKGLFRGLEDLEVGGREETLLRTARILNESWRLEETCCHSNSSEKPSANTDVKNSKGVNNNLLTVIFQSDTNNSETGLFDRMCQSELGSNGITFSRQTRRMLQLFVKVCNVNSETSA